MHAFVVTVGDRSVAFIVEQSRWRADAIVASTIFRSKLADRDIGSEPVWNGTDRLVVRDATASETAEAQLGMARMRLMDPGAPEGAGATMLFGEERGTA